MCAATRNGSQPQVFGRLNCVNLEKVNTIKMRNFIKEVHENG